MQAVQNWPMAGVCWPCLRTSSPSWYSGSSGDSVLFSHNNSIMVIWGFGEIFCRQSVPGINFSRLITTSSSRKRRWLVGFVVILSACSRNNLLDFSPSLSGRHWTWMRNDLIWCTVLPGRECGMRHDFLVVVEILPLLTNDFFLWTSLRLD